MGSLSGNYVLAGFSEESSEKSILDLVKRLELFHPITATEINQLTNHSHQLVVLKLKTTVSPSRLSTIISSLENERLIAFAHPTTEQASCKNAFGESIGEKCIKSFSNFFYLRLEDADDQTLLNLVRSQTNTELINQNSLVENWFTLSADKSASGNALQLSNSIVEKYGVLAEPDIIELPVAVPTVNRPQGEHLLIAEIHI